MSKKERWFNILSFVNERYIDESNPLKQFSEKSERKIKKPKTESHSSYKKGIAISINAKKGLAIAASVCVLLAASLTVFFVVQGQGKNVQIQNPSGDIQNPSEAILYNQGDFITDVNGNKLCLDKITYKKTSEGATLSLSGELEFSNKIYNSTTNSEEYYQFNESTVFFSYKLSSGEQGTFHFCADLFDSQTAIMGGAVTFVFDMDETLSKKIESEINEITNSNVLTLALKDVMVQGNSTSASLMLYQFQYKNITIE
jgi:hypothetical protein